VCYKLDVASLPNSVITKSVFTAVAAPDPDAPGKCNYEFKQTCLYDANNTEQSEVGITDCANFNAQ